MGQRNDSNKEYEALSKEVKSIGKQLGTINNNQNKKNNNIKNILIEILSGMLSDEF